MVKNYSSFKEVLNKTPLRVSFGGGGTELPDYYSKYGGCVVNTTIDLFIITRIKKNYKNHLEINLSDEGVSKKFNLNKSIKVNDNRFKIHLEVYKKISEKYLKGKYYPIKITTHSDAPIGSGLGTSSTLTVSLIKSMCGFFNIKIKKMELALLAFEIERKDLKLLGGLQDHLSSSFGGLNVFKINKAGLVKVKKINAKKIEEQLDLSMILIYTNISRDSSEVIKKQNTKIKKKNPNFLKYLHLQKKNVLKQIQYLKTDHFRKFHNSINTSWTRKNELIDDKFVKIKKLMKVIKLKGSYCTKISGAGNGGFIFSLHDPFKIRSFEKILKKKYKSCFMIRISISKFGSKNYYYFSD